MQLSLRPVRAVALALAFVGLAACDGDSTGSGSIDGGTYNVIAATVPTGAQTSQRVTLPGVLYTGGATYNGSDINVREELLNSSITLDERDRSYIWVGTFRMTNTGTNTVLDQSTVSEVGTYDVSGGTIYFAMNGNTQDVYLDGSGTVRDGTIRVAVTDPYFGDNLDFEFRR